MIQVIDRMFRILEMISRNGSMRLKDIAGEMKLKTTTVGNILTSLRDLGYLMKTENNAYSLSPVFYQLSLPKRRQDAENAASEETVMLVANELHETAVLSVLHATERCTIAEATYEQAVTVNRNLYRLDGVYNSVTGRVLLAFTVDSVRERILMEKGLPTLGEWSGVESRDELMQRLEEIRRARKAFLVKGEICALGVPVWKNEETKELWGALGVFLPCSRFNEEIGHRIEAVLTQAARKLSFELFRANKELFQGETK